MLTRDPNKVGYSGYECPDDDPELPVTINIDAEQYMETSVRTTLPKGKTIDDIDPIERPRQPAHKVLSFVLIVWL